MTTFNPKKLAVTYVPPATEFKPVEGRKYTLTHSDATGELFLSIGNVYDYYSINPNFRDEVLAEWATHLGEYILKGKVYVSGGEYEEPFAKERFQIFKREIELALTAIIYGDKSFYFYHPWLLDAPICIHFDSDFHQYNQILYYGTPRQFLIAALQQTYKQPQA